MSSTISDFSVDFERGVRFGAFLKFQEGAPLGIDDEYREWKIANMNQSFAAIITALLIFFLLNRGSIINEPFHLNNPFFLMNFYNGQLAALSTTAALFLRFGAGRFSSLKYLDKKSIFQFAVDLCALLLGTGPSTNLLAKVYQGACPAGTSIWDSQHCNTASAGELPTEMFAMCFVSMVFVQACSFKTCCYPHE